MKHLPHQVVSFDWSVPVVSDSVSTVLSPDECKPCSIVLAVLVCLASCCQALHNTWGLAGLNESL